MLVLSVSTDYTTRKANGMTGDASVVRLSGNRGSTVLKITLPLPQSEAFSI